MSWVGSARLSNRDLLLAIRAGQRQAEDEAHQLRFKLKALHTEFSQFREHVMPILNQIQGVTVTTQADVDAVATQLTTLSDTVTTGVSDLTTEIAALSAAHPDIDLSGVQTALATLTTGVQSVTDLDTANATPAPAPVDPTDI